MEITFLRHGESTGNASGIIQGTDSSPLSERGRSQAVAVGERLSTTRFDLVVSSDMERAVQTAEALDVPFSIDARWREMDVGEWDGLTGEEIAARFTGELAALARGEVVRLGGTGETIPELAERVSAAVQELVGRLADGQRALVVCHGGVIEAVVAQVLGVRDLHRVISRVTNTSLTTVAAVPDRLVLTRLNDAAHLGPVTGWAHSRMAEGELVLGLVRHGESNANARDRWQGQSDSGLSERGRRQAKLFAEWYGSFSTLYSSPLVRAHETARMISANGSEPETHPGLVELGMGAWEGRSVEEIRAGWPELWARIYDAGEDLPRGGDGETWQGMLDRVAAAVAELAGRHEGGLVGIVSHGAAIRAYVSGILGLDHMHRRRLAAPANTSVSHVAVANRGPVLADYNVAPHLE